MILTAHEVNTLPLFSYFVLISVVLVAIIGALGVISNSLSIDQLLFECLLLKRTYAVSLDRSIYRLLLTT